MDDRRSEGRPTVAAILPRGEAIRNFVYSRCLDLLGQEANLAVLSVIPNEAIDDLLRSWYSTVFALRETQTPRAVAVLRELLDIAHGRWLWSEAARERWTLRDLEAKTTSRRMKRLVKKALSQPFASPRGLQALSAVERKVSHWLCSEDEYLKLFQKLRPSLVFNASQVHGKLAIPPVQAAQRLRICTAAFVFSWDNLTSQGRIIPPYDFYLVWNEAIKSELLRIYGFLNPDQVFVTGTPQFDFHFRPDFYWSRERFCREIGADPTRPIVLYTTGMANHMPGEPRVVEGIARVLESCDHVPPPQLVVRVYPKDETGRFDWLKERLPDVLFPKVPWERTWLTPLYEDAFLWTNMLRHAAVGVNVASTTSLELCMFDKPVINIGYDPPGLDIRPVRFSRYYDFDHYRPLVEAGAVEVARSQDELSRLLMDALTHPEKGSVKRKELLGRFFGETLDGQSHVRVARALLRIAERASGRGGRVSRAFSHS